ncbi:MAG TPA: TonB-dependent receptor [Sphingomicrobium sp.]|nr:TonB-dependent receptor [Sphingomicrobium sp.]
MHRISTLLSAGSGIALVVSASPGAAQATDPAAPVDPAVEAQEQPADSEADPAPGAEDTIVVTGLRRSLQSSQNIKRNSEQIVDAIVAEDIGKLPDITVSDTAARIPGVQVERQGGEASRVLLRGLDRSYYTTTYNGREIFTAETRSVALQDFPAGAISAVEAFKTSTANLVEPGLAGLINVRSRRPFDFTGFEAAGSVWLNYPKQSRDVKPNAQLLFSNRWDAGEGEFGALINFSYTRLHYQDSIRRHAFFIADNLGGAAGGRSPDWPEIHYAEADRWRPSINGALQWRPSADLELYAEGLWQGYREEATDRMWQVPLWGGSSYSNLVVENGQVISGTVTNPAICCNGDYQTQGFQGATKRKTNTYQFAVGGRYDAGPLRISGDIARTDSTFKLRAESVDFGINNENFTVNWFTGRPGGDGPTLEIVGLDFENPANYNYRGFFERYLVAKGDDWQARLDAEYEPGLNWLPNIQAGVRYTDRDAGRSDGERYWNANSRGQFNIPISQVPLDYRLFRSAFRGDDDRPTPTTWLAPTFQSVWDNLEALRQFNVTRGIPLDGNPNRSQNNDANPPAPVPTRDFNINEKTLAGYGQLKFDFEGSMPIDGVLGVRVVRTEDRIQGFRRDPNTATPNPNDFVFTPLDVKNEYTNWLPNLNVNFHFSDQLKLRFAATKTITRPLFEQLNPGFALGTPNCTTPSNPQCEITGSGGNPFLDPLRSNNYDASLEYYFSRTGFASAAVFRRDMRGFIVNRRFEALTDEATGLPVRIDGPVNTNKGRIQGFEAQVSTFFDWEAVPEWARGFGAQANVTYIDAKLDLPLFCAPTAAECVPGPAAGSNATVVRTRVPDVSKWTYNLVGMYERGPLTARLSYNHRSSYPEGTLDPRGNYTLQGRGRGSGRLDWSSSFVVSDNLTLFFDWTNILNIPFRSDIVRVNYAAGQPTTSEDYPMVVRYNESVMSGGIRFRL